MAALRALVVWSMFLVATLARAQDTGIPRAEDPCAAWRIHGYSVAMTLAEAEAVRGGKRTQAGILAVEDVGRFTGQIRFDAGEHLALYTVAIHGAELGPMKAAMTERLGSPVFENRLYTSEDTLQKLTVWSSDVCDANIGVSEISMFGGGTKSTRIIVSLQRASAAKKKLDSDRKAAEDLLK